MKRFSLLLLAATLCRCSEPPVQTAADRAAAPITAPLSGQVVVQGPTRGDAVIFLYDAAHPPPPQGTGRPLSFVQIPAARLFAGALHDASQPGPFAADFTFPTVSPGTYLLAAMLDADACLTTQTTHCRLADFDPFYAVTREPNGGDLLGGHLGAQGLARVVVPAADGSGHIAAITGAQVVLGGAPLPDRPAFTVALDPARADASGFGRVDKAAPTPFQLVAAPLDLGPVDERQAVFLVRYVDENQDGIPDLGPTGAPLLWPRLFVRKIADVDPARVIPAVYAGLRDENDLDDNGILDATGKSYDRIIDGGLVRADGNPALVLLASTLVEDPALAAQLAFPDGGPDVTRVVPVGSLNAALIPQAFDLATGAPVPLAALPPGRYAVIVESFTGQSWRLPNELSPLVASAVGLTPQPAQGFVFVVAP
jgi:hypothetical protein